MTVAIGRLDLDNPNATTELDYIDWSRYTVLPNTAGCKTVEEALFTARLGRSVTGSNWVKLEVIPDPKYLLPDPIGTLRAAETLVAEGFVVLPYIHADPVLAKHLEEAGCATVMPLGSAIGSGQGILTLDEIKIIIENADVPVVVDAGIGAPSDAALAMETGADAVLVNTAVAKAEDPALMAAAMRQGVEAGREAYPRRTHPGEAVRVARAARSEGVAAVLGARIDPRDASERCRARPDATRCSCS